MTEIKEFFEQAAEAIRKFGAVKGEQVAEAGQTLAETLAAGGFIFSAGNGGSAADAQHFAAELVGRFLKERGPYRAAALTTDTSALTSISNDYGFDRVFERQLAGLARPGDAFVAISTSGNSPNLLLALEWARGAGVRTVGLYGRGGGKAAAATDFPLVVDSDRTPIIQQVHAVIVHALCAIIEERLG